MMKRKLFCLAAACWMAASCCGAFPAEAASSVNLKENYAMWRQSALDDEGMLTAYLREILYGAEPQDGYFFSAEYPLATQNSWYQSGFYSEYSVSVNLYANILQSRSAVFFTKSQADADAAEAILQKYDPDQTGRHYNRSQTCFSLKIRDAETMDAIRNELTDAHLTGGFYDRVPVYEHHRLSVPYLTCYSDSQFYSPSFQGTLTEEFLQSYLDENALSCTIHTVDRTNDTRFYVVPDERISFREHWALALRFYHDLGIVPDMTVDRFSQESYDPQKGAGVPYDLNTDTFFDAGDVNALAGFLLYEGSTEDPQAGDMNADGLYSAADLTLMKRALLAKNQPPEKELPDPPVQALNPSMPSVGTIRIPVFAVDFPDCTFPLYLDMAKLLTRRCFSPTDMEYGDYPFESIAGYFERASYGRMQLTGEVFPYAADHPIDWYAADNAKSLVEEIMTSCDPLLDYRLYDADKNDILDSMILVLPEEALKKDSDGDRKPDWWPFSIEAYSDESYDGVRVGRYCVIPYEGMYGDEFVSKMAHELGHAMGLPDYYKNATATSGDSDGLFGEAGKELMDEGEGDLSACSKLLLGWLAEDEIQVYTGGTQTFCLKAAPDAPSCILIPKDPDAGLLSEYFLIEYITPNGNQSRSNAGGIRILHVQADVSEGDFGPELTYSNPGRRYDKSHQKQRVLRLVNDDGYFYPVKQDAGVQDMIDGSTAGFHWYDADGNLTLDPGLTVKINAWPEGPFYDPDSDDPFTWLSGIAQITISENE